MAAVRRTRPPSSEGRRTRRTAGGVPPPSSLIVLRCSMGVSSVFRQLLAKGLAARDQGPRADVHQLHQTAFKRTLCWTTVAEGRRIHDLRHTAACLWLARGVDPATLQAWMGHASIATTNLYLHHLGTPADRAGLDRLNDPGHNGGTNSAEEAGQQ